MELVVTVVEIVVTVVVKMATEGKNARAFQGERGGGRVRARLRIARGVKTTSGAENKLFSRWSDALRSSFLSHYYFHND